MNDTAEKAKANLEKLSKPELVELAFSLLEQIDRFEFVAIFARKSSQLMADHIKFLELWQAECRSNAALAARALAKTK